MIELNLFSKNNDIITQISYILLVILGCKELINSKLFIKNINKIKNVI